MPLSDLRRRMDRVDEQMLALFVERMAISRDIGRVKAEEKLPLRDPVREGEKLDALAGAAPPYLRAHVRALWRTLFGLSRLYQAQSGDAGEQP